MTEIDRGNTYFNAPLYFICTKMITKQPVTALLFYFVYDPINMLCDWKDNFMHLSIICARYIFNAEKI